ncbi:MAG: MobC family plasmid mobilization relaxosome protein [Acidobacteria bacterium]|nr:MobC family plasmid mobilization relaxosome protein [Acidobacteriota bacterium]
MRQQASAASLSVSEFLRRRALGFIVQPPSARADAALVSEVNRIGVNVNQLAKAMNADRDFRGDWEAIAVELRRVLGKVAKAYGS